MSDLSASELRDLVESLTPTQELIGEVLAARHRLGENMWTFSRKPSISAALNILEGNGLVNYKSGVVEYTWRAWLSEMGKKAFLSQEYVPPKPVVKRDRETEDLISAIHLLLARSHLDSAGIRTMTPDEERLMVNLSDWWENRQLG